MKKLSVDNLYKSYRKKEAVRGISFEVYKGDVFGILGENGAGKSTTLAMIATLCKPDKGDIFIDDVSVVSKPKIMRKKLGYVPQDIALYPCLSGIDNLIFWGKVYHLTKSELNDGINRVKQIIGLSDDVLNEKISSYSGGMKRRINIGAALVHNPDIVIMDEPTVGIDVNSRNQIIGAINELKNQGKTIIYTGHYMEEIEAICNRICIMANGEIIKIGKIDDLLSNGDGTKASLEKFYLAHSLIE